MPLRLVINTGRTRTVHEYVLKSLREAIIDGRLGGGTHLVQTELADQLDVSVTPVREALRDLATEGLVVFDPHHGALVRSLDLEKVREVYDLRIALEPLLVRRVMAKITDGEIRVADQICKEMEQTSRLTEWVELNRQFHASLSAPDQDSRLAGILTGLRDSASHFVGVSLGASMARIEESNREHAALIDLYRSRDVENAVALTVQHLHTTVSIIGGAHEDGLL
jgi:DNA-binding GntR family transcriptional regulator